MSDDDYAIAAVFAFPHINPLFSLNFVPAPGDSAELRVADYFLILFPVFTLTASFPVISVTLRNNLQSTVSSGRTRLLRFVILPLMAVIPPVFLAISMPNLEFLLDEGNFSHSGMNLFPQDAIEIMLLASKCSNICSGIRDMDTSTRKLLYKEEVRHTTSSMIGYAEIACKLSNE
ncbi:hypothetical protein J6590_073510 [Homalodisca vitripennis]|nr:hypothetical protein J6590_073510 [Homalodisca vitripennis]